jgi:heme O synthase-like polyprenyltransferase
MSSAELIAAYLRQRVHARVFVPLVVLMAGAGWLLAPAAELDVRELSLAALRALVLVMMFRVWDDLEDRAVDLRRHRDRVMVSSGRFAPFVALMVALAILGVGSVSLLPEPAPRMIALVIAAGVVCAWYGARPMEHWNPIVGGLVVLAKYPLIAYAVAPVLPTSVLQPRPFLVLLALYVLIYAYECVDDRELRHAFRVRFSGSPLS